ncbi:MAG: hypothetical protein HYV08_03780 [Deltaproteobacteria bacterium]|nr:hypothetical protein [Deltaproteobacteria bacterium]MBI3076699.1 hypothetical protein [Deltaproteobacteria bacterium]
MADTVQKLQYFYIEAPDNPGEGARALETLKGEGVNLVAFSGFPGKGRKAQLDFVPADPAAFKQAAKKAKWKVVGPKSCFVIQGEDRVGALAEHLRKLAAAKINVTATDAIAAGAGRYGVLLWVKPRDVNRAAKTLGAS